MKITIEAETEEERAWLCWEPGKMKETHENVKELFYCGLKVTDLVKIEQFAGRGGTFPYLIAQVGFWAGALAREDQNNTIINSLLARGMVVKDGEVKSP